jgi:UDP-galactopyranose mutase
MDPGNSCASTTRCLVVGAGFTGSVIARELAEAGFPCDVVDAANYVGGHCATTRDRETNILYHVHGPHTFHSDDVGTWEYLHRFAKFYPYRHEKFAIVGNEIYEIPINLTTIRQFFGRNFSSEEAKAFIVAQSQQPASPPGNFEEAGLATVGRSLYEAFYKGYTQKQWGRDPKTLPADVFGRVPIRFTEDRNYFHHMRQGQPLEGYSALIERVVDHPLITLRLGRHFGPDEDRTTYRHTFWTGAIDHFFKFSAGRLSYRTLKFEQVRKAGTHQRCAVINYCDQDVPFTRVTEHKHFSPWETHLSTIVSFEYPGECGKHDAPYYPVRSPADLELLRAYEDMARQRGDVSFAGRLGCYRYMDMDRAVIEALNAAEISISALRQGLPPPAFFDGYPHALNPGTTLVRAL